MFGQGFRPEYFKWFPHDDHPGEFTYWLGARLSVIGSILISGNHLKSLRIMAVIIFPLTMVISIPIFNPQTKDWYKGETEYGRKHVRIRLDDKMRKSMQELLKKENIINRARDIMHSDDGNEIVET